MYRILYTHTHDTHMYIHVRHDNYMCSCITFEISIHICTCWSTSLTYVVEHNGNADASKDIIKSKYSRYFVCTATITYDIVYLIGKNIIGCL